MQVVYQDLVTGVVEAKVDLRPYFSQYGDKLVRPAFAEYFRPPVSMLEIPQAAAVDYLIQVLGLTEFEALMSKRALTICYNGFILKQVFGSMPQIGATIKPTDSELIIFAKTALFDKG
jgi:hypothetical protein